MGGKKRVQDLKIINNKRLNERHFLLDLLSPEPLPAMLPGQFVQVRIDDSPSTFLRRPFSIHSVDTDNNSFRLFIQIKGEGTKFLSKLRTGDKINTIYPLGNSFSMPSGNDALLVGGGCGIAPLLFLSQILHLNNIRPTILLGFRTRQEIAETGEYAKYGNLLLTTDDGSEGERGLVTDHSIFKEGGRVFSKIYCCGPEPMMRAVARIAGRHGTDCEVSLENTMACGFGVCLCCITPTDKGNERVCVEGPVFNTKRLQWT